MKPGVYNVRVQNKAVGTLYPIQNSRFEVTVANANGSHVRYSGTTDKKGNYQTAEVYLPEGTNYITIRQTKVGAGYVLNTTPKTVTVTREGNRVSVEGATVDEDLIIRADFYNEAQTGGQIEEGSIPYTFELVNQDKYNRLNILKNAQFKIRIGNDVASSVNGIYKINPANSKIRFSNLLNEGNITVNIEQAVAPDGYRMDFTKRKFMINKDETTGRITLLTDNLENIDEDDISIDVENRVVSVIVRNEPKPMLVINKVDAENGAGLTGARFKVKLPNNTYRYVQTSKGIANVLIDAGLSGRYEVTETIAPDGYVKNKTIALDITFDEEKNPTAATIINGLGEDYADNLGMVTVVNGQVRLRVPNTASTVTPVIPYSFRIRLHNKNIPSVLISGSEYEINIEQQYGTSMYLNKVTTNSGLIVSNLKGTGKIEIDLRQLSASYGYYRDLTARKLVLSRNPDTKTITFDRENSVGIIESNLSIDSMNQIITLDLYNEPKEKLFIKNLDLDNERIRVVGAIYNIENRAEGEELESEINLRTDSLGYARARLGRRDLRNKVVTYTIKTKDTPYGYDLNSDIELEVTFDEQGNIVNAVITKGERDVNGRVRARLDNLGSDIGSNSITITVLNKSIIPTGQTGGGSSGGHTEGPGGSGNSGNTGGGNTSGGGVEGESSGRGDGTGGTGGTTPGGDSGKVDPSYPGGIPGIDPKDLTYSVNLVKSNGNNENIRIQDAKYSVYVTNEETGITRNIVDTTNIYGEIYFGGLVGYRKNQN